MEIDTSSSTGNYASQPMEVSPSGDYGNNYYYHDDNNENSTITSYDNAVYKKKVGRIILNTNQFVFEPTDDGASSNPSSQLIIEWKDIQKHQVSPVTYPKSLLKIIIDNQGSAAAALTFQFPNRIELEKIRKDITKRLQDYNTSSEQSRSSRKRTHFGTLNDGSSHSTGGDTTTNNNTILTTTKPLTFGELDPTAIAVTRSSLLAANPALRKQHKYLVEETETVTENDFWETHRHILEEEYARISGLARAGTSSVLQSHLPSSGRVTLGVQEMRQIFLLYPAVHRAYEEKVPLELSDEQFWRKYLESEYFHKDRGRIGTAARNHSAPVATEASAGLQQKDQKKKKISGPTYEQQEARAAAVGTDDLFSRYDQKLQEAAKRNQANSANGKNNNGNNKDNTASSNGNNNGGGITGNSATGDGTSSTRGIRKWGRNLAVGQFDLASTFETERGKLLEGPKDMHPPNQHADDNEKGARVIQKYNRHWAMVLHPDQAVAGVNLMDVARRSVLEVLPNDPDAEALGGVDTEMKRLVGFANASDMDCNHATCIGVTSAGDDANGAGYEPLTLKNIEAYYSGKIKNIVDESKRKQMNEELAKRHSILARAMVAKTKSLVKTTVTSPDQQQQQEASSEGKLSVPYTQLNEASFPAPELGRELLSALTKKMVNDSKTEQAASLEIVKQLPEDFRERLQSYFRRSSELLRHFFGLRKVDAVTKGNDASVTTNQKLARIVRGMETFYREMEVMRKDLPQTDTGEIMRKMCLPIMDQLDWAFKLHRESESQGNESSGGFVTVE